jgi:hypothetical protein
LAILTAFVKKISLISLLMLYKMSFLFDLIFKEAIAILRVNNLVNFLLIMFFIVIIVIGLNLYRWLR